VEAGLRQAAYVIENLLRLWAPLPVYGPVLLALMIAWVGSFVTRRWVRLPGIWAAIGIAAGWAWLAPSIWRWAVWRWAVWPRSTVEFLVLPAVWFVVADLARLQVRSRWVGFGALCFAAWWLADSPAGRIEFWRVGFGGLLVAWLLNRVGAGEARMAVVVALTAWCGLLIGRVSAVWDESLAVLAVGGIGVRLGRRDGSVAPGLTMVGLLGADLGGGRLVRGGISSVDLACLAALGAPLLVPRVEARLRRRFGGAASIISVVLVAPCLAALTWLISRALRS
jgi:hypothetical protein